MYMYIYMKWEKRGTENVIEYKLNYMYMYTQPNVYMQILNAWHVHTELFSSKVKLDTNMF